MMSILILVAQNFYFILEFTFSNPLTALIITGLVIAVLTLAAGFIISNLKNKSPAHQKP